MLFWQSRNRYRSSAIALGVARRPSKALLLPRNTLADFMILQQRRRKRRVLHTQLHTATHSYTGLILDFSRVARLPTWWQFMQPVTELPSCCCESSPSGSSSIESHQAAG